MDTKHTEKITVDILDDHPAFGAGLRSDDGLHVRFLIPDGEALIEQVTLHGPPHVALLDISRPQGMNGYQCCQWLRTHHPATQVLAMTAFGAEGAIQAMLAFGARGFLTKGTQVRIIGQAIRSLYLNGRFVNEHVPEALMRQAEAGNVRSGLEKLTPRQFDVIALLDTGLTYKGIADQLFITESAVKRHFEALYGLFGVGSQRELLAECHRLGLLNG